MMVTRCSERNTKTWVLEESEGDVRRIVLSKTKTKIIRAFYSCCQKGSRSALFFLHLDAWMWLKRNRWIRSFGSTFFFWMTHLCLQNIDVSISHLVYLSVSLRGTLGLKLISALVMGNISHDHERHSNVAVFRSLTETVESKDRLLNI